MEVEGGNPPTSPTPEPPPAFWEDFIDIFFSPRAVFERRKGWNAWPVLLGLTVVMVVLYISWQRLLGPVMDLEMQRAMAARLADNPNAAQAMEQARSMNRITGPIGMAIVFPLGVLLVTLLTWLAAQILGAKTNFATVFGVVIYSQIVKALSMVAGIVQAFFLDVGAMDSVQDLSLSAARFLDQPDTSTLVVGLAARVDVFVLWATALIAIGLAVTTRLSKGSAWAVAIIIWLLAALPAVAGAALAG